MQSTSEGNSRSILRDGASSSGLTAAGTADAATAPVTSISVLEERQRSIVRQLDSIQSQHQVASGSGGGGNTSSSTPVQSGPNSSPGRIRTQRNDPYHKVLED